MAEMKFKFTIQRYHPSMTKEKFYFGKSKANSTYQVLFIDFLHLLSYTIEKCKGGMIMAQATFSVRMDETLKKQFDGLCQDFGMNASTAINVFARAVVRQRRIPFEISSPETDITREGAMQAFNTLRAQAKENGVADMSLDDINKEIDCVRAEV